MSGYTIEIIDLNGIKVFETEVEEPLYMLNLSDWTGHGLYLLHIKDTEGKPITVRKILLE